MDNDDHLSSFAGLPALEYFSGLDVPDPAAVAWRLSWGGLWRDGRPCATCAEIAGSGRRSPGGPAAWT